MWFNLILLSFSNLVIPFVLICFARHLRKQAPNPVSRTYGRYNSRRITMSTENKDVWVSVNLSRSESWQKIGRIMLVVSIGVIIVIGVLSGIAEDGTQLALLGACIPMILQFIVGVVALVKIESEWTRKMRL